MTHDLRRPSLILDPLNGNSMGVVWVIRLVLRIHTRVRSIHLLILLGQILKTKGFFNSNVLFSAFDIVNSELHQRLNSRHSSTHGSLEYRIERNKLLRSLLYLLKTRKVNDSLRSNTKVLQP